MASVDPAQQGVVLASFENRHVAEHMVATLGRKFRKQARHDRNTTAFVLSANKDGSLKLTQSRVLTAEGVGGALIRILLAVMVGLLGLVAMLKGERVGRQAAGARRSHLGSDERVEAILAQAGPNAAFALICCDDRETRLTVAAAANDRAVFSWDGSRAEFLASLDPGPRHDWVRAALGESSTSTNG